MYMFCFSIVYEHIDFSFLFYCRIVKRHRKRTHDGVANMGVTSAEGTSKRRLLDSGTDATMSDVNNQTKHVSSSADQR